MKQHITTKTDARLVELSDNEASKIIGGELTYEALGVWWCGGGAAFGGVAAVAAALAVAGPIVAVAGLAAFAFGALGSGMWYYGGKELDLVKRP